MSGWNALSVIPAVIGTAIAIGWFVPAFIVYCCLIASGRAAELEEAVFAAEVKRAAERQRQRASGEVEIDFATMTAEQVREALEGE